MKIDGACHCGAISFTAEIDPNRVVVCHCTDCQTMSGAPFRPAAPAPIEHFVMRGEPKLYVKIAQSGNQRIQGFCGNCGTALFAKAVGNPTEISIRLGCVRQRAELPPRQQIWTHSAMPWLTEIASLPGSPQAATAR
jgi:hypothetical protein